MILEGQGVKKVFRTRRGGYRHELVAVDSVSMLLMEDHVQGCVTSAVKSGDAEALTDEVMDVVRRGMGRPARATRSTSDS